MSVAAQTSITQPSWSRFGSVDQIDGESDLFNAENEDDPNSLLNIMLEEVDHETKYVSCLSAI